MLNENILRENKSFPKYGGKVKSYIFNYITYIMVLYDL